MTRPRRHRLITAVVALLAAGLLVLVAPPDEVLRELTDLDAGWVVAAVALELASCLGYVLIFRRFFREPPPRAGRRLAWVAMGAGAVLPGGNISSAAATGILLHRHGVAGTSLVRRCCGLLCLLTGIGFALNGAAGILLLAGAPGGPHDLLHAGAPILVSILVLGAGAALALLARRLGERAPAVLRELGAGLDLAWESLRRPHPRVIGAIAFITLDMAALWAACRATGHPIGALALVLAYCIGYLATLIPVPAGLGVLDSGLAGTLVLYGFAPVASVGAVLAYHAIAIWIPGAGGLLAWWVLRRRERTRVPVPVPVPATAVATPAAAPAPAA